MRADDLIQEAPEPMDLEDLVKDLDAILDAWFLGAVRPALDEACRARQVPGTEAA